MRDKRQICYATFTLQEIKARFGLKLEEKVDLFSAIPEAMVGAALQEMLRDYVPLALAVNTEKARSELIVVPILTELWKRMERGISLFSGSDFTVDAEQGLNGACDFLISRSAEQLYITAPVVVLVEAKNESIKAGLAQGIAEMIAARLFNEQQGNTITTVYGGVTTGSIWKFLKLAGDTAFIDVLEYHISQPGKILGILMHMVSTPEQLSDQGVS
jgi:hypothetical protein